ncbi:hypothetical protein [Streptomyces sp. YIM 98790]|uniref:hypothetical protein n=1 Tax=Streptomyces sp. YIM 98790 TaxID=2689077 RepID=UPI00140BA050|nr:hypothetical protein [Streptomyces sp. YIM 98790]
MNVRLLDGDGRIALTVAADRNHVTVTSAAGKPVARVSDAHELAAALAELAPPGTPLLPMAGERPWPTEAGHAVLLLGLSARWPWLVESADLRTFRQHHLTLAYALPLALDAEWRRWAEQHASLLLRGGQLVPVPASDLVAVEPCGAVAVRHRRLLRRHTATGVKEHQDYGDFLRHWSAFTHWRYGRPVPDHESAALLAILDASGAVVREFIHRGEVIGRSVVCLHEASRTVFDLMATWQPSHAPLRPGIYSAVHSLLDAADRGLRYSLCYGQFPYKDDILGTAERLALEDLLFP